MKKQLSNLLALIFMVSSSLLTFQSDALVNPGTTQTDHTDWLAFIFVKSELLDNYYVVCSGVLVAPNWVLSSQGCLVDPYEVIETISTQNEITYFVELWGQFGLFEVVDSIPSPDGRLVMHKLNQAATVNPIERSTLNSQELLGTKIEVPGFYESESLGNSHFNPNGSIKVDCLIHGELFFYNSSFCYILSPERIDFTIKGNFGTVVNPIISGPLTSPLDDDLELEFLEEKLYIDFEEGGYPCNEDIGSPVVASINGAIQLVGMVTRVGVAARLPLCANSLYNLFSSSSYYEEFITQTLLRDAFDSDCPATTRLRMEEQTNSTIRLFWEPEQSATGYRILYSPRLGYAPIQAIDLGNVTEVSAPVDPDTTYYVSLLAYNDNCTGQPSDPVTILINKP